MLKKLALIIIFTALLGCQSSKPIAASNESIFPLKLIDQISLFSEVVATPIVINGTIYIAAENGNLYAFDSQTREYLWRYHAEGGIGSTPTVAHGRLYFLSRDGVFHSIDQQTGQLHWKANTGGEQKFSSVGGYGQERALGEISDPWDFYLSAPLVVDNTVYVGSSDHHLYAWEVQSGKLLFRFNASASIHSSPVYASGALYFGTWGSTFFSIDATKGTKNWQFTTGKDESNHVLHGITASALIDQEKVFFGARDGFFYALNRTTGDLNFKYDASNTWVLTKPVVDETAIYFATSDTGLVIALDKITGKALWKADTKVWTYTDLLVINNQYLVVGTMAGELYAIDKTQGKIIWKYQTAEAKSNKLHILDAEGKFNNDKLFGPMKQLQASVEEVKDLGAFIAAPIWVDQTLIAVTARGEVLFFK